MARNCNVLNGFWPEEVARSVWPRQPIPDVVLHEGNMAQPGDSIGFIVGEAAASPMQSSNLHMLNNRHKSETTRPKLGLCNFLDWLRIRSYGQIQSLPMVCPPPAHSLPPSANPAPAPTWSFPRTSRLWPTRGRLVAGTMAAPVLLL